MAYEGLPIQAGQSCFLGIFGTGWACSVPRGPGCMLHSDKPPMVQGVGVEKQYGRFLWKSNCCNGGFCARSFWRRVKKEETWAKLTGLVTSETSTKEWQPGQ